MIHGFMLDSARCLESRSYYRHFIDFAAKRGIETLLWHFTDDQGCALRFDCLPEAASANAYTKAEMRELIAYARQRGITIIPELASLGHTRYITGLDEWSDLAETDDFFSSICPVSPRTQALMSRLLDEVIDVFDAPLVHLGLDEINIGHHPLTREALQTRSAGQLFAEHLNRMHAQLQRHGRRAMMWADHLLANPDIVPDIPRDVLMCNWQYGPEVCESTTQRLLDWGFEVIVCPALISHNQPLFPSETFALPNVRNVARHRELGSRVLGTITTIWTPTRFLPNALWPAVHYAAAIMHQGPDVEPRAALAEFARDYYGFEAPDAWLDGMLLLMEHAPRRDSWAVVARLGPAKALNRLKLAEDTERFAAIRAALRASRVAVTANAERYDSLLLLADVLTHAWRRAADAQSGRLTEQSLRTSEHLMSRLDRAWDADRFANDPRKHDCRLLYDSAEHLLIAFGEGTRLVRQAITPEAYVSGMAGH